LRAFGPRALGYIDCIGISFLNADERRLFPNSVFRHSELGSKILNIFNKYLRVPARLALRTRMAGRSAKTCPPSGRRVCVLI
jgi:hypothetical protein